MDLYIDRNNVLSLIGSRTVDYYEDCVKLMRRQLDVQFNFSKEELKNDEGLMFWYQKNFTQGVGDSEIKFGSSFPEKPLKSNSANTFNSLQLSAIYLLDDENVPKLKDTGSVMIGEVGEEVEILQKLFFLQNDYLFEKKWRINGANFRIWDDLRNYSLPLTDIVIADAYILKNKDNDLDTIDYNLIKYLGVLTNCTKNKVNVVIITNPQNMDYDYATVRKKIDSKLKETTGKKPSVTIIKTRKEHDRTILTNYKRIYSGDTFNFWNSKGIKISNGREISYSSLAKKENNDLAISLLCDFQNIIDFLQMNNPEQIEGDKKSKFLNFD